MAGRIKSAAHRLKIITYVRDLDLVSFLQMFSKCFNEVLGGDVLDGVSVLVDEGEVLLKALVRPDTPIPRLTSIASSTMIFIK